MYNFIISAFPGVSRAAKADGAADSDSFNLVSMNDAIALEMGGTDAVPA